MAKIPVILDTDIGFDIDDVWALVMMLKCPELDVKLIVTDSGDTTYRAKIVAKLLEIAERTDIPIGIGIPLLFQPETHAEWVVDYDLSAYPGPVLEDGIGAIIETIMGEPEPITLICIGPVPNIAAALQREPRITQNSRFIGMHGSLRIGYLGKAEPAAEFNVIQATKSAQKVFSTPWDFTITPLDTCGLVTLNGDKYRAIFDCPDPLVQAIIENYRIWLRTIEWEKYKELDAEAGSSVLYDCVAIYLAFSDALLQMEQLGVRVDDAGFTIIDNNAQTMNCATEWKDLAAFEDFLVARLIN